MKFRPLYDRVMIRRLNAEEKTSGGIISALLAGVLRPPMINVPQADGCQHNCPACRL